MASLDGMGTRPQQSKGAMWFTITLMIASFAIISVGMLITGGGPITVRDLVLCAAGVLLALSIFCGWRSSRTRVLVTSEIEKPISEPKQEGQAKPHLRMQLMLFIFGVAIFVGALFIGK